MNLQVGVKVLIRNSDDKFLFVRRGASFKPGPQQWDIPGGRIEPHEALHQALTREVSEETGLHLDGQTELLAAQDIFAPDAGIHVVRLTYVGTATGDVQLSDEHDSYQWMSREELAAEPYVDEYLRQIFDA